jgi:hypothetical protein
MIQTPLLVIFGQSERLRGGAWHSDRHVRSSVFRIGPHRDTTPIELRFARVPSFSAASSAACTLALSQRLELHVLSGSIQVARAGALDHECRLVRLA